MKIKHALLPLAISVAIAGSLAAPVFAQADNALEIAKRADTLRAARDWAGAEKAYTQFLAFKPEHASARLNRAMCRIHLGRNADAIADISSGLVLNSLSVNSASDAAISFTNRGVAWNNTGQPLRALVDCLNATRIDPNYAAGWSVLGDAWYALGNLEQANICAEKAHALNAGFTTSYTASGAASNAAGHRAVDDKADTTDRFKEAFAAAAKGENEKALALYSEIIEIHPLDGAAWGNRAILHSNANRIDAAIADFTTAITVSGINKSNKAQANNLANRSQLYSGRSQYAEAVADLQLAAKVNPEDTQVPDLLKTALANRDSQPSAALPAIERAKILLAQAKEFKGGLFDKNGAQKDAVALLDKLNTEEPNNAEGWYLRGVVEEIRPLMLLGRDEKALAFYEKALALNDSLPDAHVRRAKQLMAGFPISDVDRKKALADYDRAIALGVKDATLFVARSRARSSAEDSAGALADLNEALKLEPKNTDYLRDRAGALEVLKRWKDAIADRTALLDLKPDASSFSMRGADYVELKDWAHAFGDFDKAIALQPDDADYYYDRAVAYRKNGQKEKALADFRKARTLSPDYPEIAADLSNEAALEKVRHNLGHMMRGLRKANDAMVDAIGNVNKAQRQKDKAAARLQRLLAGDKRTDDEILKSFDTDKSLGILDEEDYLDRGRILAKQEKYTEAIADFTMAIGLKKDYHEAYNLRGVCYENKKEYEKAFADYDKAVSIKPKSSEYLRNRGDVHYELLRFDQAWSDYDRAVQSDPKEAVNYFKRGNASFQRKNYDEAISDYDKALELDPRLETAAKNREIAKRRKAAGG